MGSNQTTIRCLVLSDTHDLEDAFPESAPNVDIILHCGDMTQIGGLSNYRRALQQIQTLKANANAELALVIAGNHDVSLDPKWWADNLDDEDDDPEEPAKAKKLFEQANDVKLLDEGIHKFTLKDGRSFTLFASPFTPEFGGYAFSYPPEDDHFNTGASTIPDDVDIVMTHGPPSAPSTETANYLLDLGHEGQHCGCPKLFKAIKRTKPGLHCFGHIHEGYGAQQLSREEGSFGELQKDGTVKAARGDGTLLVNAAIQTHGETPNNKPWVVELGL